MDNMDYRDIGQKFTWKDFCKDLWGWWWEKSDYGTLIYSSVFGAAFLSGATRGYMTDKGLSLPAGIELSMVYGLPIGSALLGIGIQVERAGRINDLVMAPLYGACKGGFGVWACDALGQGIGWTLAKLV